MPTSTRPVPRGEHYRGGCRQHGERDLPLPDTGSLRTDLIAWATASAADLARPEGRLFLSALVTSIADAPEGQSERDERPLARSSTVC
ncbi:MAG: TetR-like C-terminal domain-containing protein [Trebonia sp.]